MKKSLLVIELDEYNIKILQSQPAQKGWRLEKAKAENIFGKSDDSISALLKDILKKEKINKTNTVLVLPRSLVTVRYLQLPSSNSEELDTMVDMQVVRQIPYSKEEMVYDYCITGLTQEGYSKILVVIVHKDTVSRYVNTLEKAGVNPYSIELNSFAFVELAKYIGLQDSKLFEGDSPVVLLDVDYASTNVVVIKEGSPIFTRAISIGRLHIDNKTLPPLGKEWIGEWAGEVNRSLAVFQKDYSMPVKKVLIFGGEDADKLLNKIAGKIAFSLEKYDISSYLGSDVLKGSGVELSDGVTASFLGLLGAVREGTETSVNLIPLETKSHRISVQKRRALAVSTVLLAGILVVLGAVFNKKIQDKKTYLASLEKKLSETNPIAKELMLKKERLMLIKKQLSVEGTCLDILRELYNVIPQKTALTVFVYDDIQGVTIKGVSPAMSEVFELVPKLENSPYFEKVTTRSANQRKIKGQELTDFQIDCVITPQGNK
jgi:type IV pilus assembly protein PilM